ncbi:AP2-associated kinase [Cladophialophora carrionii]|uniref:Mediator of RNA polymerase II transcription subunit 10 n=1 Tax=Cladophialophora carrionii TaxID=86049 RepID=A0A1C1CX02_9EURO|nr:AP2-associated kinase [Cladophialophora carrionii]
MAAPRSGAQARNAETTNAPSLGKPDSDQDHDYRPVSPYSYRVGAASGTRAVARAGIKGKRFDNAPDLRVHRHRKTKYSYRIGIRLAREKLLTFPQYNGRVKDSVRQWGGSFVTLKVPPWQLRAIDAIGAAPRNTIVPTAVVSVLGRPVSSLPKVSTARSPFTTTTSAPSRLSVTGASSFSDADLGQPNTPFTTYPSPEAEADPRCIEAKTAAAQQDLLLAQTTGSFSARDTRGRYSAPTAATAATAATFQIGTTFDDLPVAERLIRNNTMAPVKDTSSVHNTIKGIIQHLTDIQLQTHGYIPQTQDLLVDKLTDLTTSLAELKRLTSAQESPNNYIHQVAIAPEIVDYVDDGRNPDIFTRDFVEIVQRGNAVVHGKQRAFRDFTEVYARKLKEGIPGVSAQVDRVLKNAGFEEQDASRSSTNGVHDAERNVDP